MIDDATRYHLLKLLVERPESTQRDLAAAMNFSLGKTNYCIKALVGMGLVKIENIRGNSDKAVCAYLLTPEGVHEKAQVTVRFLHRKMAEYDVLQTEIAALRREVDDLGTLGLYVRKRAI
ncbi:MarR family EPS-associated transcriptional regulator [Acidithiobacillus thiooxidans]|uniref:MarR family EPS-associated transcriptional regulator n=1 Tax=Acidithiobacillus thiooxidans TaxID=930 RepID=A0A1C2IK24_ACITH|nr:MarR family EPS-associated transcriptional regulator [Acidithiobacillus thiooxidans]OCX72544.1 MarR family EPS-associated transcriptional regulator [Acidithiobacillus thiooxidans]OCX76285.1 MarR family EPS-associated transcriptional regulator [Acidithiobacillus thiooxidans]OCX84942.1 MarR family EPS-associated transcriptional regulator [Acidithiobacillus thiooxidans]OCX89322.1 MarR family EPS-associated transcriptional regulator [Acidithiobacillus thiooxidans]OFC40842.1 MarR family EPS-asso